MILNGKVWVILRPNYKDNILESVGVCGTGFFVEKNKFITARHLCNESSFIPNKEYNNNHLIIISPKGEKEIISLQQCTFTNKDITYIKTTNDYDYLDTENILMEEEVYNIGYPTKDYLELINNDLSIKEQRKQFGKVIDIINNHSCTFIGGKIENIKVIIVNYSSEEGFSGGPVFNKNNKVVGLMSYTNTINKITTIVSSSEF